MTAARIVLEGLRSTGRAHRREDLRYTLTAPEALRCALKTHELALTAMAAGLSDVLAQLGGYDG